MVSAKYRLRFRKVGDLRLVSHLDLKRCFERLLRRADIPVAQSQGFHPAPRLMFASALPLGVAGHAEVAELELTEPLPPEELFARLTRHTLPGLEVTEVRRIDLRQQAQVIRAAYRLAVPAERLPGLPARCEELLARPSLPVPRPRLGRTETAVPEQGVGAGVQEEIDTDDSTPAARPPRRGGKDKSAPRTVDVRPYLEALAVRDHALEITLRVTPTGTARADEVLALLGLDDLLDAGAVLARTATELADDFTTQPSGDREAAEAPSAPAGPTRDRAGPPRPREFPPSVLIREGNV